MKSRSQGVRCLIRIPLCVGPAGSNMLIATSREKVAEMKLTPRRGSGGPSVASPR
jgi:hypothetical protein